MFGTTDTATVASLQLTDNDFHAESLRITMGAPKVVFRAVPKGWGQASSLKIRVYWIITNSSSAPVAFDVYAQSRGAGDDFGSLDWGTGAAYDQSNGEVVSLGEKRMNIHSFTWNAVGKISDSELITLSLYRNRTSEKSYVYDGIVHVMGVSIEAIFP